MFSKKVKECLIAVAASVVIATGSVLTIAAPAQAATVPNRYFCDPGDGWCYQVNGTYNPSVGKQCHWKRSGMAGTPHQMYYTSCPSWGQDYA